MLDLVRGNSLFKENDEVYEALNEEETHQMLERRPSFKDKAFSAKRQRLNK